MNSYLQNLLDARKNAIIGLNTALGNVTSIIKLISCLNEQILAEKSTMDSSQHLNSTGLASVVSNNDSNNPIGNDASHELTSDPTSLSTSVLMSGVEFGGTATSTARGDAELNAAAAASAEVDSPDKIQCAITTNELNTPNVTAVAGIKDSPTVVLCIKPEPGDFNLSSPNVVGIDAFTSADPQLSLPTLEYLDTSPKPTCSSDRRLWLDMNSASSTTDKSIPSSFKPANDQNENVPLHLQPTVRLEPIKDLETQNCSNKTKEVPRKRSGFDVNLTEKEYKDKTRSKDRDNIRRNRGKINRFSRNIPPLPFQLRSRESNITASEIAFLEFTKVHNDANEIVKDEKK